MRTILVAGVLITALFVAVVHTVNAKCPTAVPGMSANLPEPMWPWSALSG